MQYSRIVEEKIDSFLKSRRKNGKRFTQQIIKILLERRYSDPEGWVRAKEIKEKNCCCDQTLFRELKDLEAAGIIERWEKNGNTVYYRLPTQFLSIYSLSKKELLKRVKENNATISESFEKLHVAESILKELGIEEPHEFIKTRHALWKTEQVRVFKEFVEEGRKNEYRERAGS